MTATSYAMSDVMSAWDLNESSGGYDARRGIFEMPHCSSLRASLRANQKTGTTAQCPVKGRSPASSRGPRLRVLRFGPQASHSQTPTPDPVLARYCTMRVMGGC
jgi:hypothetical protein